MESILIVFHLQINTELLHTQLLAFAHLLLNPVQSSNHLIILLLPIINVQQGIKRIQLVGETYRHIFQQPHRLLLFILLLVEVRQPLTVPVIIRIIFHRLLQRRLSLRRLFQEQIILRQLIQSRRSIRIDCQAVLQQVESRVIIFLYLQAGCFQKKIIVLALLLRSEFGHRLCR